MRPDSSDARLEDMVPFFAGRKQVSNVTVGQLIWFTLLDGIPHRGQLEGYLRAANEKVPSIYGPSAAEPWT